MFPHGAELRRFPDAPSVIRAAAELFVEAATDAVARNGRFAVALSGGNTPRGLYELLATTPVLRERVPWQQVHLFWGDERAVPPDHEDSNYRMARLAMIDRLAIPPTNVHRVRTELGDPAEAAERYALELRRFFDLHADAAPTFDLVLLGMGDDGHTASLFPGTTALDETKRLVVATHVAKLDAERITMTYPVINHAAQVVVLVTGESKAGVLSEVLASNGGAGVAPAKYPIQRVAPTGRLIWLADEAAASRLRND